MSSRNQQGLRTIRSSRNKYSHLESLLQMNFARANWENCRKAVPKWRSSTPCTRKTNSFWAETNTRMQNIFRTENIYCECFFQERIEEIGEKQSQSDVRLRHAFEKLTCFGQNLKLEKPNFDMSNIYFECFLAERIDEIGAKQSQSDVRLCNAFE